MPAKIATLLYAAGILGLFALNRDRKDKTSPALWIPVIWLAIAGSRMASQWIAAISSGSTIRYSADQIMDGNPFDRALLTALLVTAVGVLIARGAKVGRLIAANGPLVLFFVYCAISILWSDYLDISFKRWVKAVGDVAVILVVLTDVDPSAAVKRLLSRVGFVLVPVSLLLDKYYSAIGRGFTPAGDSYFTGVATSKNELGGVCLLFGLGAVWRLCELLQGPGGFRKAISKGKRGLLIAHGALLLIVLRLFWSSGTMTALACFLMAATLMVTTSLRLFARKRWVVHALVIVIIALSGSALFLGAGAGLVKAIGKDPTLTGRTAVWDLVISLNHNFLFGTGFESFWLGPRLDKIWSVYWWHPNEAHNGYIEVFLNLGWIGVGLLILLIVTGYRNAIAAFRRNPDVGRIRLAYFVVAVVYNFTESAVRILHPVWLCFLLATIFVPGGWTPGKTKTKKASARNVRKPLSSYPEEVSSSPVVATGI